MLIFITNTLYLRRFVYYISLVQQFADQSSFCFKAIGTTDAPCVNDWLSMQITQGTVQPEAISLLCICSMLYIRYTLFNWYSNQYSFYLLCHSSSVKSKLVYLVGPSPVVAITSRMYNPVLWAVDWPVCLWLISCITACGSILLHYCIQIGQKALSGGAVLPVVHSYFILHRSA